MKNDHDIYLTNLTQLCTVGKTSLKQIISVLKVLAMNFKITSLNQSTQVGQDSGCFWEWREKNKRIVIFTFF